MPQDNAGLRRGDLHACVSDPVMDTMNFLNEITLRYPHAISFAPGRPYHGSFEVEHVVRYLRRYVDHLAQQNRSADEIRDAVFQYGPTAGQIRNLIAAALAQDEQVVVQPESIVVTVGCQEAMVLALRAVMAGPDDVLLVSSPCYVGITGAARLLDLAVRSVPERDEGFCLADVEAAIDDEVAAGRRPRAFYVVPDHSNPSGMTMPLAARRALLDVAAKRDLLILEDSPYRLVSPGDQVPSLKSLDEHHRVLLLGSFSKTAFPGARLGYVVADQLVVGEDGHTSVLADELAKIKSMITVNTSSLSQAVIAGLLLDSGGGLTTVNKANADYYDTAMKSTLARLDECLAEQLRNALGVRWNKPSGGFFLTMRVPFLAGNEALFRSVEDFGVIWTPMAYFYPDGGGERSIRLSISSLTETDIDEGIARLTDFIQAEIASERTRNDQANASPVSANPVSANPVSANTAQ